MIENVIPNKPVSVDGLVDWRETTPQGCIDHYIVDGKEWELAWAKIKTPIPGKTKEFVKELLKNWQRDWRTLPTKEERDALWEKEAGTYVQVPCSSENCLRKTWWTIRELKIALEKNFEHELCGEFFCEQCRGVDKKINMLMQLWESYCPRLFREGESATNTDYFYPAAWQAIKNWGSKMSVSSKSLWIWGVSGVCKSRMMYQLLKDYAVPSFTRFKVYSGGQFRQEREEMARMRFSKDRVESEAESIDLLVFDDFAQEQMTASAAVDLWSLIDKRLSNGKKTIFLANCAIDRIGNTYGNGYDVQSLKRRLKDFCDEVIVNVSKEQMDAHIQRTKSLAQKPQSFVVSNYDYDEERPF